MKKSLPLLFALTLAALLLLFPKDAMAAARAGVELCLHTALPALFPFLFLSRFLLYAGAAEDMERVLAPPLQRALGLSPAGASCFLMGLCGGYPVGAGCVRAVYEEGRMTKDEAERALAYSNNCGPAFLFGAVAAALGSGKAALIVWCSHVLSAIAVALLFRRRGHSARTASARRPMSFSAAFSRSAREAASAMGHIGAMLVLFQVFLVLPGKLGLTALTEGTLLEGLFKGLLELTGGVAALNGFGGGAAVAVAALLAGWGGLCVHTQTLAVLEGSGLRTGRYFLGKALQGVLSAALAWGIAEVVMPREAPAITVVAPAVTLDMSLKNTALFTLPWVLLLLFTVFLCRKDGKDDYRP